MARRRITEPVAVPVDEDPKRIVQQTFQSLRGDVRGWFRGGECYRVRIGDRVYGWGEGSAVWSALLDGSFRPDDFGRHNAR